MTQDTQAQTSQSLAIYNASLDRCTAGTGFLDRFYDLFLSSSADVREKFRNTSFERQKAALRMRCI